MGDDEVFDACLCVLVDELGDSYDVLLDRLPGAFLALPLAQQLAGWVAMRDLVTKNSDIDRLVPAALAAVQIFPKEA